MNPNYPDKYFCPQPEKIKYFTVDGGTNWSIVGQNGRWRDIHYKHGNTNVLFT